LLRETKYLSQYKRYYKFNNCTMQGFRQGAINVAMRTEQETGLRFCITCNKLVPLDQFRPDKRMYKCIPHHRAARLKVILGSHEKRAFNSLRCRARQDMILFGHDHMIMGYRTVMAMLTPEQLADFSNYCLIPKRPDQPLTKDNSIVVTSVQRMYIVGNWKKSRDSDQYERDLQHMLLASPTSVSS